MNAIDFSSVPGVHKLRPMPGMVGRFHRLDECELDATWEDGVAVTVLGCASGRFAIQDERGRGVVVDEAEIDLDYQIWIGGKWQPLDCAEAVQWFDECGLWLFVNAGSDDETSERRCNTANQFLQLTRL
ncbi:hypothetical protein FEM03_21315 [Phragmitibacter flavus]|uniref:Uncharacterized protein n=2 Tax=Phragmitibacter flavus TaxID=2576071 RepID=A0A5R8K8R4_9BACT|nr:hypothetical protein FEM03_21315 [Phragmitibacter flavus]